MQPGSRRTRAIQLADKLGALQIADTVCQRPPVQNLDDNEVIDLRGQEKLPRKNKKNSR